MIGRNKFSESELFVVPIYRRYWNINNKLLKKVIFDSHFLCRKNVIQVIEKIATPVISCQSDLVGFVRLALNMCHAIDFLPDYIFLQFCVQTGLVDAICVYRKFDDGNLC